MEKSLSGTDTNSGVARSVDQASSTAHRAIDKASDAARPAVERVTAGAHQVVDKLAGAASSASQLLDERTAKLKDAQSRMTESCRGYVREKPITSLGVAVAAGFLLSWLVSRR
ncbi:MAG: hypothetical protein ABI831_18530 [Betaproteobacteria bacterium]